MIDPIRGSLEPWQWRFFSYVLIGDGCWTWLGKRQGENYGAFSFAEGEHPDGLRTMYAHRYLYELFVGPIPDGYQVDHLCHNPTCCNPEHLDAVPQRENLRRRHKLCRKGHSMEGHNRQVMERKGDREFARCRICYDAYKQAQKDARRARGLKRPGRRAKVS